jgi:serine protease
MNQLLSTVTMSTKISTALRVGTTIHLTQVIGAKLHLFATAVGTEPTLQESSALKVNNSQGIAGLVPLVNILPIRALSWRGGLSSDIAASIIWASGGHVEGVEDNPHPAQVINLSFTTKSACSETFQKAIDTAVENGSVIAVAAGNANSDVRDYAPANCNNVVAVGATDATGKRAAYSNHGEGIDISAPGGDVNASGDLGVYSLSNSGEREPSEDSYAYRQGTSMSAAHVTAALARLSALHPDANPT